jgi:hypothetical protein
LSVFGIVFTLKTPNARVNLGNRWMYSTYVGRTDGRMAWAQASRVRGPQLVRISFQFICIYPSRSRSPGADLSRKFRSHIRQFTSLTNNHSRTPSLNRGHTTVPCRQPETPISFSSRPPPFPRGMHSTGGSRRSSPLLRSPLRAIFPFTSHLNSMQCV